MKPAAYIAWIGLSVMGCTTAPREEPAKAPHDDHDHHAEHTASSNSGELTSGVISLVAATQDGPKREVAVLVDRPELKLATITLRAGTELPEHSAPVPVTIQLLEGAGTARFGGQEERIHTATVLLLEANVAHAIVPDEGTTMRLLVHYLRSGRTAPESSSHHHDAH